MHCILSHFKTGSCYTACIDCFTRTIHDTCSKECINGFGAASHIRYFTYTHHSVSNQLSGIFFVHFILSGARHSDIYFLFPRLFTRVESCIRIFFGVRSYNVITTGTKFEHIVYFLTGNTIRVIDVAVRTGNGNHFGTQFCSFNSSTPCHISETGDSHCFTFKTGPFIFQHLLNEIAGAKTGSFGTDTGTAELHAFTGESTGMFARQLFIHTKHIAYFTTSYTYVTSRYIHIRTYMAP